MKIIRICMSIIISNFLCLMMAQASGDGFISVVSEEGLKECLKTRSACKLDANITATSFNVIDGNVILDLNGHSIVASSTLNLKTGLIFIDRGGKLTIHDSVGTGKVSTGPDGNVWAPIQLVKDSNKEGIAELVMNNGTLEGYYYGIVGNGNDHNTKVTINGGTIKALNVNDSVGIYQPQNGELVINGGTISGGTGIEIRSGSLRVNNGTVKGVSPTFNRTANRNGTTTNGAGIAIAQHTTKNPITVAIYDGAFSGQYALYEWNPHNNSQSDLNKIKLNVYGGEFKSTVNDGYAVYSEDFTKFISGGKFNTGVREYLTDDAKVTTTMAEDLSIKKKNSNKIIYLISGIILLVGSITFTLYKKGIILNKLRGNY